MFVSACYNNIKTGQVVTAICNNIKEVNALISEVANDCNADFLAMTLHKDEKDREYYENTYREYFK